jgi:opacity protein-like surface antigen
MKSMVLAALPVLPTVASQQAAAQTTNNELARRLDALEKENRNLKARLDRLEHKHRTTSVAAQAKAPTVITQFPTKSPASLPPPYPVSSFDGFYAGVLGGHSFNGAGEQPQLDLHGALIGGFAGYNVQFNKRTVVGIEFRAFGDFSRQSDDSGVNFGQTLPIWLGSCSPIPCGPIGIGSDPLLSYSQQVTNTVARPFSADLTAKVGFTFAEDWLVYTRLGAGAALFKATRQTNTSTTTCSAPVIATTVSGGFDRFDVIGCGSTPHTSSSTTETEQVFSPYLVAGAGLERNIGSYFGRVEADLLFHPVGFNGDVLSFGPQYYGRITAGLGYRFH